MRRSFGEVFDGQRTGRFLFEDLKEAEKAYLGCKIEILLRDEFDLPRGAAPKHLEFSIAGVDVASAVSREGHWRFLGDDIGELCLVVDASDASSTFSLGLLRSEATFVSRWTWC